MQSLASLLTDWNTSQEPLGKLFCLLSAFQGILAPVSNTVCAQSFFPNDVEDGEERWQSPFNCCMLVNPAY